MFHLQQTVTAIDDRRVRLSGGETLEADLVVVGIGVRLNIGLAERAGLTIDRGVEVNRYLETSRPGASSRGRHRALALIRIQATGCGSSTGSWRNARGRRRPATCLATASSFAAVPFFWSQHYDVSIAYVGHAGAWDKIELNGDMHSRDCAVRYQRDGRVLALATIFRDTEEPGTGSRHGARGRRAGMGEGCRVAGRRSADDGVTRRPEAPRFGFQGVTVNGAYLCWAWLLSRPSSVQRRRHYLVIILVN